MRCRLVGCVVAATVSAVAPAWPQSGAEDCGGARLVEVAAELGVAFVHDRGETGDKHLPETMGAGLAWLDYDGDGWWDLYLVQSGPLLGDPGERPSNRLFRNLSGRRFVDVTAESEAGDSGYGQGVLAADLDGRAGTDLVITNFGADVLLRNSGTGRFRRDETALAAGEPGWSSSAAAADADGDGDLDLYVSRYLDYELSDPPFCGDPETGEREYCDPSLFEGLADRFFRNRGDGRWVESRAAAGLVPTPLPPGRGLGVSFVDLDGDLAPEIYVANDLDPNFLFHNRGDGSFEEVSLFSGAAVNREGRPEAGMGIALVDPDGDGLPDLLVTNFDVETNTHYRNAGGLVFADVSAASGFGPPSFNLLGFGIGTADFDGDGRLDILIGNGHIFERPRRDNTAYRQPAQLLLGDEGGGFSAVRCRVLEAHPAVARGLALGDFDNDGDLDAGLQENGGRFRLLRDDRGERRWVGLRLVGAGANREAVGARVELETDRRRLVRWVTAGDSYQSTSDRRVVLALAPGETPERLRVVWRSGDERLLVSPPAGRYLTVVEAVAETVAETGSAE